MIGDGERVEAAPGQGNGFIHPLQLHNITMVTSRQCQPASPVSMLNSPNEDECKERSGEQRCRLVTID